MGQEQQLRDWTEVERDVNRRFRGLDKSYAHKLQKAINNIYKSSEFSQTTDYRYYQIAIGNAPSDVVAGQEIDLIPAIKEHNYAELAKDTAIEDLDQGMKAANQQFFKDLNLDDYESKLKDAKLALEALRNETEQHKNETRYKVSQTYKDNYNMVSAFLRELRIYQATPSNDTAGKLLEKVVAAAVNRITNKEVKNITPNSAVQARGKSVARNKQVANITNIESKYVTIQERALSNSSSKADVTFYTSDNSKIGLSVKTWGEIGARDFGETYLSYALERLFGGQGLRTYIEDRKNRKEKIWANADKIACLGLVWDIVFGLSQGENGQASYIVIHDRSTTNGVPIKVYSIKTILDNVHERLSKDELIPSYDKLIKSRGRKHWETILMSKTKLTVTPSYLGIKGQ